MPAELSVLDSRSNFIGFEDRYSTLERASFVVLPVPFEQSTSYGKGTASGPAKILEASRQVEFFDEEFADEPCRRGIATLLPIPSNRRGTIGVIEQTSGIVQSIVAMNKFPILMGGEHTISIGGVQGFVNAGTKFSVLHLDAHSDLRDEYEGNKYSHACAMRRIRELQPSVVLCGIRSQCSEEREFIQSNRIAVFYAHELKTRNSWAAIFDYLSENVYLTIDCDFFDPSIIPAVGTPEPGGFFWDETIRFLRMLVSKRNLVGFDVVELAPQSEQFHSQFTISKLMYKLIGFIGRKHAERFPELKF